jgi:hypothetical protein
MGSSSGIVCLIAGSISASIVGVLECKILCRYVDESRCEMRDADASRAFSIQVLLNYVSYVIHSNGK